MGIDMAAVMDALRIMAVQRKADMPDRRGKQFNRSFLGSVRRHGRVFEVGMMTAYKLRTGDLLTDVGKVPQDAGQGQALAAAQAQRQRGARSREVFRRAEEEEQQP